MCGFFHTDMFRAKMKFPPAGQPEGIRLKEKREREDVDVI